MRDRTTGTGRRWITCAMALALCMALGGCAPEAEDAPGVLYEVVGGKNPMYLLGSIHVGNDRMKRFGSAIGKAMERSDVFVFECDTDSTQARQDIARLMRGDKPLGELISQETYALLTQAAAALGTPMDRYDGLRPWAVTSLLSTQTAAVQLGVKDAQAALRLGVEEQVRVRSQGKDVRWLETPEEQLLVLDRFSPALQDALLKSACQLLINPAATDLAKWPEWWLVGDTEAFAEAYAKENDLNDPALTQEYHDALVTGRNQRMAQKLKDMLEGPEDHTYFVTVGLMHLALPQDSIPWELEQMGYTVTQIR